MPHTIAIVDDHVLIAKALTGIIDLFKKYTVLYEAENGQVLIERCKNKKNIPDIVMLDISMPVMDGFETAKWLKQHHPEVLVLALSMQDDEQALIKMIKSGARGYLLKNVHPTELEKALDSMVTKGFYYPDWATNKVMLNMSDEVTAKPVSIKLSDRELAFLQFVHTELSYKEIGDKMFCSGRTVESYRDSLFEKIGVKTRVGLVVYAIRNGLVTI